MKVLFTEDEFLGAKFRDLLPVACSFCDKEFKITKRQIHIARKRNQIEVFCSPQCHADSRNSQKEVSCPICKKRFLKPMSQIRKSKNHFCSRSCNAIYNNHHNRKGQSRSKLEIWLEEKLPLLYPKLPIKFNTIDEIQSELDIYFPSLHFAIELNGIFHYEPIFGQERLGKIQSNDARKFQACIERHIELCIIDVSGMNYFKERNAIKFLDIIARILDQKLSAL